MIAAIRPHPSLVLRLGVTALALAASAVAASALASGARAAQTPAAGNGTRWMGVRGGPHAVGFEVRKGLDRTRRVNRSDAGTRIGMAIWYPAREGSDTRLAMTALEYRLLELANPPGERERALYEDNEANSLVAWRHIGIVDLTADQARASLRTRGMAVPGARPRPGRHPVVMVLGGQYYLSTTAEILASHGFLVVSAFRFSDQSNEIGTSQFSWYLENSVRDAEWALNEIRGDPRADGESVSAIGHGGGGIQAMLFSMRNTDVDAVVNIDAGNFSSRSRARELAFYSPRLMRAPFLYMATRSTKAGQDQFEDFAAMKFSERYEVILENPELRHHDLSDLGRGVTAPMAIRGQAQDTVQRDYADVHDMTVRFLLERAGRPPAGPGFREWVETRRAPGQRAIATHAGVEPAPTVVRVLETLDRSTPAALRQARLRDPDAPLFQPNNLLRVTSKALASRDFETALAVADFAIELHPAAPAFREQKSQALEATGVMARALDEAAGCAAMPPGSDWRASVAINECKARVEKLRSQK